MTRPRITQRRRVRRHHQRRARQIATVLPVAVLALLMRGACARWDRRHGGYR